MRTELVDQRNFDQLAPAIAGAISSASFVGLDCETEDSDRHPGLNAYCKYNAETGLKPEKSKLVFDINRMVMTGLSIYPDGHDTAYYFNLAHADEENRLPWFKVKPLLDMLPEGSYWICHNASFEYTAFAQCLGYHLDRVICTLQMAVSAYGPDEYSFENYIGVGRGGIGKLIAPLIRTGYGWEPGTDMSPELSEIVYKIIAKDADSDHSYNGFVKSIRYGYGLKEAVRTRFGHEMTTYQQVLKGRAHMGQLTGPEVVQYGAEDAYWALQLFHKLLAYMIENCPAAIDAFFKQENPMVPVYSAIWQGGMRVNVEAVYTRRKQEREAAAQVVREIKAAVQQLLPFDEAPHEGLLKYEKWYQNHYEKYREMVVDFAALPDVEDAYEQVQQVRSAVSNAWASEKGHVKPTGLNLVHYMPMRVLLYDLQRQKVLVSQGKVQSDGEYRGKLQDRMGGSALIEGLTKLSGIEQRMKLYLTPYTQLMDPDTGRLHPVVSSMLATRRMAASYPNPMQLAKRGTSTYVRGFFKGDHDDHVVVSIDWSGIELVEIGEMSGDPGFIKAFGQLPHDDLHSGAAAAILAVETPELTEEMFKDLRRFERVEDFLKDYDINPKRLFTNLKGEPLTPAGAYKYWRTEVGKGANFNYWYSGFLATIGERMGWSTEVTGNATERYRMKFPKAEEWRVNLINEGCREGFITLPDGQRRVRFEATNKWFTTFVDKFEEEGIGNVIRFIAKKISKRAQNQLVNAMIQGTCATIAKRSILRINDELRARDWDERIARFMIPIHDELVFSVHRKYVHEFIPMARGIMIDHPDLFTKCKLDASPSVGLTFEPFHEVKATLGQIELFEMPKIGIGTPGGRIANDDIPAVVDYLYTMQKTAA